MTGAWCVWLAVTKSFSTPHVALVLARMASSTESSGVRPRSSATIATRVSPTPRTTALAISGSRVPVAPCVRVL